MRRRHRATVHVDDSLAHTRGPPAGHYRQTPAPRRSTRRHGRIPVAKAPIDHQQPRAAAGAEPEFVRSLASGSWITVRVAKPKPKLAVILKPRTLFRFHAALKRRKYRWLFSSGGHRRPGPKGPSKEIIDAIVAFKRRNPRVGCPRIAQEIAHAFGIDINKDIVRRVLAKHYRPEAGTDGPSWLSFIGHMKDSLWSVDLFRCESMLSRSHWVMVVMDVFTRRIIGFGVERADPVRPNN